MMPRIFFKNNIKRRSKQGYRWHKHVHEWNCWSWVMDTCKLIFLACLLLCLKFRDTKNVFIYEKLREVSIPLRVRGWLPPQCLHVYTTWPPPRHSARGPHSAPVTRTPMSNTPPSAIFLGVVEAGHFAFSVPRCLTRLSPSPLLNHCLHVPFSMTSTWWHFKCDFLPHIPAFHFPFLPSKNIIIYFFYVYYFLSIPPTNV